MMVCFGRSRQQQQQQRNRRSDREATVSAQGQSERGASKRCGVEPHKLRHASPDTRDQSAQPNRSPAEEEEEAKCEKSVSQVSAHFESNKTTTSKLQPSSSHSM